MPLQCILGLESSMELIFLGLRILNAWLESLIGSLAQNLCDLPEHVPTLGAVQGLTRGLYGGARRQRGGVRHSFISSNI